MTGPAQGLCSNDGLIHYLGKQILLYKNSMQENQTAEKHIPGSLGAEEWLPRRLACFHRGKERGAAWRLKNFPRLCALAYKHTAALSAFMFIQIFASGTSQQNYSVCKFNLWGVTSNRRLLLRPWWWSVPECWSVWTYWDIIKAQRNDGRASIQVPMPPITACLSASLPIIFILLNNSDPST